MRLKTLESLSVDGIDREYGVGRSRTVIRGPVECTFKCNFAGDETL
jgi:hypothetical protein